MRGTVVYPKTSVACVDVLSVKGAVPINCRASGNEIIPALAPRLLKEGGYTGITFACYSRAAERFFLCSGGNVYASGNGCDFSLLSPLAGERQFAVEEYDGGEKRFVLVTSAACLCHDGTSFKVLADVKAGLACGVMRCGRLFGADEENGYKLRWSGEGGALDSKEGISGAGWLLNDCRYGKIVNVAELGGKLIVVGEYGITVMSVNGNPENFSVGNARFSTERIYGETAAVAGDKLLFFTESGFYSFDGEKISEVTHGIQNLVPERGPAASFGGDYFTGVKVDGERAVFVYCRDGGAYIVLAEADAFAVNDGVYCFSRCGTTVLSGGGRFVFTSGKIDFGSRKNKVLKDIFFDGFASEIIVECEEGKRTFTNIKGELSPHMRGYNFKITVKGDGKIENVKACAEVLNEV